MVIKQRVTDFRAVCPLCNELGQHANDAACIRALNVILEELRMVTQMRLQHLARCSDCTGAYLCPEYRRIRVQ